MNGMQESVTEHYTGRLALYRTMGLEVKVKILDARKVWGRLDFLITPIEGKGEKWVSSSTLSWIYSLAESV